MVKDMIVRLKRILVEVVSWIDAQFNRLIFADFESSLVGVKPDKRFSND